MPIISIVKTVDSNNEVGTLAFTDQIETNTHKSYYSCPTLKKSEIQSTEEQRIK